eukprot:2269375-Ditylum_brightwellii.AAC.1
MPENVAASTFSPSLQTPNTGRWYILVREYETDGVIKDTISPYRQQHQDERDVKTVFIVLGHLAKNNCSKARRLLQYHGL